MNKREYTKENYLRSKEKRLLNIINIFKKRL